MESDLFGDFELFGVGLGLIRSIGLVPPINEGYEKFFIGSFASAFLANEFQIRAGNEPPVTEFNPPIPESSSVASSRNRATDADN